MAQSEPSIAIRNKVCLISPGTHLPGEWALLALGSFPGLLRQTLPLTSPHTRTRRLAAATPHALMKQRISLCIYLRPKIVFGTTAPPTDALQLGRVVVEFSPQREHFKSGLVVNLIDFGVVYTRVLSGIPWGPFSSPF